MDLVLLALQLGVRLADLGVRVRVGHLGLGQLRLQPLLLRAQLTRLVLLLAHPLLEVPDRRLQLTLLPIQLVHQTLATARDLPQIAQLNGQLILFLEQFHIGSLFLILLLFILFISIEYKFKGVNCLLTRFSSKHQTFITGTINLTFSGIFFIIKKNDNLLISYPDKTLI